MLRQAVAKQIYFFRIISRIRAFQLEGNSDSEGELMKLITLQERSTQSLVVFFLFGSQKEKKPPSRESSFKQGGGF